MEFYFLLLYVMFLFVVVVLRPLLVKGLKIVLSTLSKVLNEKKNERITSYYFKKKLRGKHVVKMTTKLSRTTGVKNKKNRVNQLLIKKLFLPLPFFNVLPL